MAEFVIATEKRAQDMDLLARLESVSNPQRRLGDQPWSYKVTLNKLDIQPYINVYVNAPKKPGRTLCLID